VIIKSPPCATSCAAAAIQANIVGQLLQPFFGCINSIIAMNVTDSAGSWSTPNNTIVTIVSPNSPSAQFVSTANGTVRLRWSSSTTTGCIYDMSVTILSPPVATFASLTGNTTLCSSSGKVNLGVYLIGDAVQGNWSVFPPNGFFSPLHSALTVFTWNSSQTFNVSFVPFSVCSLPAYLSIVVAPSCLGTCATNGVTTSVLTNGQKLSPWYGCVNSVVAISATDSTSGYWSTPNIDVIIDNPNIMTTFFATSTSGTVFLVWTSVGVPGCVVNMTVDILSPPVATFAPLTSNEPLCSSSGQVNLGVYLVGDAVQGNWSVSPSNGFFSPLHSALTVFSWNSSQAFNVSFVPFSVCGTPAFLAIAVASSCPAKALSSNEVVGIAVGATLGGLIFIAGGILVAIWLYRVWNRRLVKFRSGDVAMPTNSTYKF
jgi:hypothetical protein